MRKHSEKHFGERIGWLRAAVLGAGYQVPLAAVMFVAETTGQPGFIVPALFAAVTAELVMGEQSITSFQRNPERPV